jgi:rhodanese-related sulfurtransferase
LNLGLGRGAADAGQSALVLFVMNQISPSELAERLRQENPPHLLDVREPEEHAFAALPNSTLVPMREIPARLEELLEWKDAEVVVYCHHGIRSLHAAAFLAEAGFTNVINLSGGIDQWSQQVDAGVPRY